MTAYPVVTFDPAVWRSLFAPTFNAVTDLAAVNYFTMACGLHANDGCGPILDLAQQTLALNYVTAHMAVLNGAIAPGGIVPPVGRIASASEGSVSVSLDMSALPGTEAWWNQTQFGATYWVMMNPYRRARYRPRYTFTGGVPPGI